MSFYSHNCEHLPGCDDCRREQGEMHKAAVSIRSWASAIGEIASRAGEEEGEDGRDSLLSLLAGIDGLSWAIRHKAEFDIENETSDPDLDARRVRLISPEVGAS